MNSRTLIVAALLTAGVLIVVLGARNKTAAVLALVSTAMLVVAVNRLAEPTNDAYCGSVINRHRTGSDAIDSDCDDRLRPNVAAAIVLGLGAFATGAGSIVIARRPAAI